MTRAEPFATVLAAAQQGDEQAVARLYRDVQPRLLRYLRPEIGDAADDIASQTWLVVFGALRRFVGDDVGFRSFVFTVARRRLADHRRSQRRRPSAAVDPEALPEQVAALDVETDVLAALSGDVAVARLVALLTPEQAEIVLLRVVADLPVEEVARLVGKTAGAVRVVQHRALKRLERALRAEASPEPEDVR
jgi:RNA polymerase sigma-70 factor (ECF subfamily)